MSDGYQMTGTVVDARNFAREVGTDGGNVVITAGMAVIVLDAAQQEEFAQLYVAACHQANAAPAED